VKFWDVHDGRVIRTIDAPSVDDLVFSPDGKLLAMASVGKISFLDMDGHTRGALNVSTEPLGRLAFSPDGTKIVVGDSRGHVHLWDVGAKRQIRELGRHKEGVTTVCWIPKSDCVATGADDHKVIVWDVDRKAEPYDLPQSGTVLSLAANNSGDLLAVGLGHSRDLDGGQVITLWHLPTQTKQSTLRGSARGIEDIGFTPDGKKLVSVAQEELVSIWDPETALFVRPLRSQSQSVRSLSFSTDGKQHAAAGDDGAVELWDVGMERVARHPPIHYVGTAAVSIDLKGRFVASAGVGTGVESIIQIWNADLTAPVKQLAPTKLGFTSVAFSPDGSKLAAASCDGILYLWKTDGFQRLPGLQEQACLAFVAWSTNSSTIATGGNVRGNMQSKKSVSLRRVDDKEPAIALAGHRGWPSCAAFSADGSLLAVGDWSGEVTLWDLATRQRRAVLRGHRGEVTGVAFSPLGNVIASVSIDKTVRIWDVNTAQQRVVFTEAAWELYDVKFRPDGKSLAAAGAHGTILIWQGDTN
jgi:WD40 repeat protein